MKKIFLYFCLLLCNVIVVMSDASSLNARNKGVSGMSGKTCVPLSIESLNVSPPDSVSLLPKDIMGKVAFSLPSEINGRLRLNHGRIEKENLKVYFAKLAASADSKDNNPKNVRGNHRTGTRGKDLESFELHPVVDESGRLLCFNIYTLPTPGLWTLNIPEGYFLIDPDYQEVDEVDIDAEQLRTLSVSGAWHKAGQKMNLPAMFSIHDDDGMDGMIPSSVPMEYVKYGYFSILYPVLESLGLRGCVSMEGRRCGFTAYPPTLNDNGRIARRLQDERGWEIQSHSMTCAGERLNCWAVDNLDSPLANELLKTGDNYGLYHLSTVSVYDRSTHRQYMPDAESGKWVEAFPHFVKPYVGDYAAKKPIFYDEAFDVDYQWGEWFRLAEKFGIKGKSWVAYNASSCHALAPRVNSICPNGFSDADFMVNYPPLLSTAARCLLEGQTIKGYKGDMDPDNSYNSDHLKIFKKAVDDAASSGGWITFGLHAYRKCWSNYRKGALVSEGGAYPDEWVNPLEGMDPVNDPLTPPARLGIKDWSEWYPCPGTRLRMMWDLFRYAIDKGLINVTSSEGFEKVGNREAAGYFTNGRVIGYDNYGLEGSSDRHPHYVESITSEVYYYNPLENAEIRLEYDIIDIKGDSLLLGKEIDSLATAYSIDGTVRKIRTLGELSQGIWTVNGIKIYIRR